MTTADEMVAALGLEGAERITSEQYDALPKGRRHILSPVSVDRGEHVYLQLPDPPEVAALRGIFLVLDNAQQATAEVMAALGLAEDALREFDGTTS